MKAKFYYTTVVLAVLALLTGCNALNKVKNLEAQSSNVYYDQLYNYFVRNDVDTKKLQKLIIYDQATFDRYFGSAAVMGAGGQPTPVNFNTQYVLAVVLPATDRATTVSVQDVLQTGNSVIFNYRVDKGDKTGYSMVPFAAVALSKPASAQSMEFYFMQK